MIATNCIKRPWVRHWAFQPIAFSFATGNSGYHNKGKLAVWVVVVILSGFTLFNVAAAQSTAEPEGRALVAALHKGGYNIYFRHAATDWSQNDQVSREGDWASCDSSRMRQLSEAGRKTAHAIGEALRRLQIPIGQVFASPYCRTAETARHMQLGSVETTTDIMNMRVAEYFGGRSAHRRAYSPASLHASESRHEHRAGSARQRSGNRNRCVPSGSRGYCVSSRWQWKLLVRGAHFAQGVDASCRRVQRPLKLPMPNPSPS